LSVEFFLVDSFEIFHFQPLYYALRKLGHNAVFVAQPAAPTAWFDYKKAIEILKELNLDYKENSDINADIAMTTQFASLISHYKNKKVSLQYGVAFNRDSFFHSKKAAQFFDAKIVHGQFSKDKISQFINRDRIYAVGYPKHDDFFNHPKTKAEMLEKYSIKTNKPIVVYLPTWDEDSSIQMFSKQIQALRKDFFVLTKPHHCTYRFEKYKKDMDVINNISDYVAQGNTPLSDIALMADIIIADAKSGASTEGIYLTKAPAVLLSVRDDARQRYYDDIFKLAPIAVSSQNLKPIVEDELNKKRNSDAIIENCYGSRDGKSTDRAVEALLKIAGLPNTISSSKMHFYVNRFCYTIKNKEKDINIQKTFNLAKNWIYKNTMENAGVYVSSKTRKPYPEVSGYYIGSLLNFGMNDLAEQYAKWLCEIQKPNGSWYDPADADPYVFDTAQIIKGLLAISPILPQVKANIIKAADWIISNINEDGRLTTPSVKAWGEDGICSELIHIYCLSPLVEAGVKFDNPNYIKQAQRVLSYYKKTRMDDILNFNILSHFYAYIIEGLIDMQEIPLALEAMQKVSYLQKNDGSIPAYKNVYWICSTGLFQFALIYYKLGLNDKGDLAFDYAVRLQNKSGGWFGGYKAESFAHMFSPLNKPNYFANAEISWAVKYFLDALFFKQNARI
jgi:malonyl-CoA O-methyltransferase